MQIIRRTTFSIMLTMLDIARLNDTMIHSQTLKVTLQVVEFHQYGTFDKLHSTLLKKDCKDTQSILLVYY